MPVNVIYYTRAVVKNPQSPHFVATNASFTRHV